MKEAKKEERLVKPFTVNDGRKLIKPFLFEDGGIMAGITPKKEKTFQVDAKESQNKFIFENDYNFSNEEDKLIKPMYQLSREEEMKVNEVMQNLQISPNDYAALYETSRMIHTLKEQGKLSSTNSIEGPKRTNLNFKLKLLKIIKKIIDMPDGSEEADILYSVEVTITQRDGSRKIYFGDVPSDKIKDFSWLKKVTHSNATVPSDKNEKLDFMNIVQDCIEKKGIPIEIIYPCSGWRKINNEIYGYVIEQGVIGMNGDLIHTEKGSWLHYKIDEIGKRETFENAINMTKICKDERASSEIFLFCHASFLTTLFEKAGCPIKFVFGLLGTTNSRKTSMVLAIAKLFNRERLIADAEFISTGCGIEKTLGSYGDSVVIIDDFKPGATPEKQRVLDEKLEQLVRFYGDRVEKKRMTDFAVGGKNIFFPIRGACIITGELISGVESSLSRMFLTEIGRGDVDNNMLAFYQRNIYILPSHAYDFIAWVTQRFNKIIEYIRHRFSLLRKEVRFEFPRYCEMYATMQITAEIMVQYAFERKFWTQTEGDEFVQKMRNIVRGEICIMEERMKTRDKSLLPLLALNENIAEGKIFPLMLSSESSSKRAEIYHNEKMYFVRVELLKDVLIEYCRRHHIILANSDTDTIIRWLLQQDVLEVYIRNGKSENSRKLPIQNGNGQRYLYINKEKLKKRLEEIL